MLSEPVNSEKSDPPYCTLYTVQCTVYSVHCTLYIVQYTYGLQYTPTVIQLYVIVILV